MTPDSHIPQGYLRVKPLPKKRAKGFGVLHHGVGADDEVLDVVLVEKP
jgi:hypothetical protein